MVYPKIDIHCHTTNRPLLHTVQPDASLDFIAQEMKKHTILYTLLLATYFPLKGTGITNFRMRNWVDARNQDRHISERFIMFGSLDFEYYFYQGFSELQEMAEKKMIRGVKIYAGYQNIATSNLKMVLKDICQKYNLPVMFHTGDCTGTGGIYAGVEEYDELIEAFSDIPFLFSHMANPMVDKVIERVKRYRNVYTDMSGLMHSGPDDHEMPVHIESVKRFYNECGIDRLMFGTDFPVQTHDHSVYIAEEALSQTGCNAQELRQFYYGNAARILKLG